MEGQLREGRGTRREGGYAWEGRVIRGKGGTLVGRERRLSEGLGH